MAGIGEALGAVGLAALFSTCVECFGYFRAAQTMERDSDILLVKLDIEKTRLLIWGDKVQILGDVDSGLSLLLQTPSTSDSLRITLGNTLLSIKRILTDSDKLVQKYGLSLDAVVGNQEIDFVSFNSMLLFQAALKRFRSRHSAFGRKPSALRKAKWAIQRKEVFQGLINDLKDLIDGLYEIAPVPREVVDYVVETDVGSIDNPEQLKLFEAATEDSYRTWSAVASSVREQTEAGTLESQIDAHIVTNITHEHAENYLESEEIEKNFIEEIKSLTSESVLMLTGPCLKIGSDQPCDMLTIGAASLAHGSYSFPFSHAAFYDTRSSLSRRLESMLDLKTELVKQLETVGATSSSFLWDEYGDSNKLLRMICPVAQTVIYCAPCVCALQTAVSLCAAATSNIHEFIIRPDDRLRSSCRLAGDGTAGLRAIYNATKAFEALAGSVLDAGIPPGVKLMDTLWLESRIDEAEKRQPLDQAPLMFLGAATRQVIIIGEAAYLGFLTHKTSRTRVPKPNDIWKLNIALANDGWNGTYMGAFAARQIPLSSHLPVSRTEPVDSDGSSKDQRQVE